MITSLHYEPAEVLALFGSEDLHFISVSKTGSRTMRQCLNAINRKRAESNIKPITWSGSMSGYDARQTAGTADCFALLRCPFHRFVSSYTYRLHRRFDDIWSQDFPQDIDPVRFLTHLGRAHRSLFNHTASQTDKLSFRARQTSRPALALVWETEKLTDLIGLLAPLGDRETDRRANVSISDPGRYFQLYLDNPGLFEVVSSVFDADLEVLGKLFERDYRAEFLEGMRAILNASGGDTDSASRSV